MQYNNKNITVFGNLLVIIPGILFDVRWGMHDVYTPQTRSMLYMMSTGYITTILGYEYSVGALLLLSAVQAYVRQLSATCCEGESAVIIIDGVYQVRDIVYYFQPVDTNESVDTIYNIYIYIIIIISLAIRQCVA